MGKFAAAGNVRPGLSNAGTGRNRRFWALPMLL
jgi:hypothetical protein